MLIGPFGFEQLAHGDTQYNQTSTLDWANGNRDVHYDYDDNGSLIEKITAVKGEANPETNYKEKVTYEYNLQNRLWRVTTDDTIGTDAVVEYTYNEAGIKVKAFSYDTPDGGETKQNQVTKTFLIDSYNHTGYAQVLEEWSPSGSHPDVTYTIGDDVISQSDSVGVRHLLYDGHGSTRQLVDNNEDVTDAFSYDDYGVMLGGNPANAATSLLYTGEMYDSSASMYYLRKLKLKKDFAFRFLLIGQVGVDFIGHCSAWLERCFLFGLMLWSRFRRSVYLVVLVMGRCASDDVEG